jgi:predicted nucleic acid-binding protein
MERGRYVGKKKKAGDGSVHGPNPGPRASPTRDARFAPGDLVLMDASPLVYLVEGEPGSPRRKAVEAAMSAMTLAGARLVASTVVWTELLAAPLRRGDDALATAYRSLLSDSSRITLESVDAAIAERAALLRSTRDLELADSIHIATARILGAAAVLGNDEAWRRVPECPPLLLVDELAFDELAFDAR